MDLPDHVMLLGYRIAVKHEPHLRESSEVDGMFCPLTKTITLCDSLTPSQRESVLLHELIHAALFITGQSEFCTDKQEEALVLALEHALFPIYKRI